MTRLLRWFGIGVGVFCAPLVVRAAPLQGGWSIVQIPFASIGETGGLAILGSGMIFVSMLLRRARRRPKPDQGSVQLRAAKQVSKTQPAFNKLVGSDVR